MSPKILVFDIETAPLEGFFWRPKTEYVARAMVNKDRAVIAYAAKWVGSKDIIYADQRNSKDYRDDKKLLKGLAKLIGEADVILTKNGKRFDVKVMNGRIAINQGKPPANFKDLAHIDTEQLARRHFDLPYYGLDYLADVFKLKHRKLSHGKFPGVELWRACLSGNKKAWKEMEKYNKHDVLATEDLYNFIKPWGTGVDTNVFRPAGTRCDHCGSKNFTYRGVRRNKSGAWRKYQCNDCGGWSSEKGAKNRIKE